MRQWVGYPIYSAADPLDPQHLSHFWVKDGDTLIKFHTEPKQTAAADSVALSSDDGGASLHLQVGLGASTYSFLLDTGRRT